MRSGRGWSPRLRPGQRLWCHSSRADGNYSTATPGKAQPGSHNTHPGAPRTFTSFSIGRHGCPGWSWTGLPQHSLWDTPRIHNRKTAQGHPRYHCTNGLPHSVALTGKLVSATLAGHSSSRGGAASKGNRPQLGKPN